MGKNNIEDQMLIIFGSNGDLAKRKLLPAVFQLYLDNLLPANFVVIGAGSQEKNEKTYRDDVRESLNTFAKTTVSSNSESVNTFLERVYYKKVNNKAEEDFAELKSYVDNLATSLEIPQNIVYYFSIPPFLYEVVAAHLEKYGMNLQTNGWKRIIVEKPFGYSYDSALDLDDKLHAGFKEEQVRISSTNSIEIDQFENGKMKYQFNSVHLGHFR